MLRVSANEVYTVFVSAHNTARPNAELGSRLRVVSLSTPFDDLNRQLCKVWFEQIAFPQACRRTGADLAHVPYWGPPVRAGVPVVTTVHDLIPLLMPAYRGSIKIRLYTRLVSHALGASALILTDSHASAGDIQLHLGIPEQRLRVVHLAVDDAYKPVFLPERLREVRVRYRLPERYFLYLGGFDPRKNTPALLRAYALLRGKDASAPPLVLAGRLPWSRGEEAKQESGDQDPRWIAEDLGVLPWVHFTDWVREEDKPAIYTLALCLVYPSLYEGFGLPILEGMACGTPVITSNRSSMAEIAGDASLLVNPSSEEEIAQAMGRIASDKGLREDLSQRGIAHARRFTWSETAARTLQAYRESLSVPRKGVIRSPLGPTGVIQNDRKEAHEHE